MQQKFQQQLTMQFMTKPTTMPTKDTKYELLKEQSNYKWVFTFSIAREKKHVFVYFSIAEVSTGTQ